MPIQKKKYAPKSKLVRRKRLARRPQRTLVNRALTPIPQRYITKMKYSEVVLTNALGEFQMNLNSLFDPNRSGVGHQPYGFDQLAILYNRYRVISAGWRIQMPVQNAGNPIVVGCLPSNDASLTWLDTGVMMENPRAKYITQNPGSACQTLRGKISIPKLVGRTKAQYMADDHYQAVINTSPIENAFLYIQSFNALGGTPNPTIPLTVVLEFTVEYFDAKHIVQS